MTARDLFAVEGFDRSDQPQKNYEGQATASPNAGSGSHNAAKLAPFQALDSAAAFPDTRARCCGDCGAGTRNKHGFVKCEHLPAWQWNAPRLACQLEPVRWVPVSPAVIARREAQAGIDQAVAAAERQVEGWSDTAYAFIGLWCVQNKGARCIGHDIVQASVERGVIQPSNAKAWGGPIQRAAREGLIKRIGFDEDPNRHGNPVPLWEVC